LGELCWWTRIEKAAPCLAGKCVIVVGIDVYHDKKTFDRGKERYRQRRSIGAFVATVIDQKGDFRTSCGINVHDAREELIGAPRKERGPMQEGQKPSQPAPEEELEGPNGTEENALEKFIVRTCEEHKVTPEYIVIYRDGVAQSQLKAVKDYEVRQVKSASPKSTVVFCVVQKRIHSRFFVQTNQTNGNPPPGTLFVDLKISADCVDNFHLIPTTCTLSTVKPVHYIVVQNDGIPIRELQQFTYTFCHLYPNWTNSIKLPFPTQAAHKMAYLLGDLKIEKPELHKNLFKSYFYL